MGELRLGELELGVADFQLRPDADLLTRPREPQPLLRGDQRLRGDAHLRAGRRELCHGLLDVGGHVAPAVLQIVLREGDLHLGLAHVGVGGEAAEEVPVEVDDAGELARVARVQVGELPELARAAVVGRSDRHRGPVVAVRGAGLLAVRLGGKLGRLDGRPVRQRALHRLVRGRRLGRIVHQARRLGDCERLPGIGADREREIGPRQLDAGLLPEPLDLVVVAVHARLVNVGLRGPPTVEELLHEAGLIAAAGRGVAQHAELALRTHQLVEALLDEETDLQPLLVHLRLRRLQIQVRGVEVVPPLPAVEDELLELQAGAEVVAGVQLLRGVLDDALNVVLARRRLGAGPARARVEVEPREDGRAGEDAVLPGRKRKQPLLLQIGVLIEREPQRVLEREQLLRVLRSSRRGGRCVRRRRGC